MVPVFGMRPQGPGAIGVRGSFADIAATIAAHLGLPSGPHGVSFSADMAHA
jgi:phosphopentomutase